MLRRSILLPGGLILLSGLVYLMAADAPLPDQRAAAQKLIDQGQWRDAHAILSKLTLDPANSGASLAGDFQRTIECLTHLQRQGEIDAFRDQAVAAHPQDWQLLQAAAQSLIAGPHHGFIVAGEFVRGDQRGGGEYATATERDRAQALQLYRRAMAVLPVGAESAAQRGAFYRLFAQALMFTRDDGNAWMLQRLTDLETLPDYERGYRWGRGGPGQGAPVDAEGRPVYFTAPESFAAATSDGQRWRWCLAQMAAEVASLQAEADWTLANFQHSQFGVQTMRQWGIVLPMVGREKVAGDAAGGDAAGGDAAGAESGPYALHTLGENETIARLATGIQRFTMPDEFNPIVIFRRLAAGKSEYAELSLNQLARIFADRQQYPRAAEFWRESIRRFQDRDGSKDKELQQIVGNWGTFESVQSQAAGAGATVEFRFRNAKQVQFTATAIKVDQLLADVKAYLQSNPGQLDWNKLQVDNIGYRLVEQDERKYLGNEVAKWSLDLDPRPEHFDRRITVTTPLQKAGAYLVVARLADGNTSRIILWVDDLALVRKQLNERSLYYVADAVSGRPVEKAKLEFFGWKQEQTARNRNQFRILTQNFAEFSDAEGLVVLDPQRMSSDYQWIVVARTDAGRMAYLGFSGVWYGQWHDEKYRENKVYVVTDRPVYRPGQTMQFKFWMREARYDLQDRERFANQKFTVLINDAMGTEVYKQQFTTDEFGGLAGEYALPAGCKLGEYSLFIDAAHGIGGGGSFRVEEYKKPEYEVLVEAPKTPVQLGDKVTATVRAKYYFGAPVTHATVKIKVERTPHDARWFPARPWDWLYGEGYWWFASDYNWYPAFHRWGCLAPRPFWFPWHPDPPELVLEREVEIGADGTVEIEIDTALAKALHGDQDHRYAITAEVVDASRRTIVGSGEVLVAREPFKVFVWTTRGHYRVGDVIRAEFQARTLDGRGVTGTGQLKLLRITYDDQNRPVENVAQEWDLNPDAEGHAQQEIKASEPGQYRLSYTVKGRAEESSVQSPVSSVKEPAPAGANPDGAPATDTGHSTLNTQHAIEGGYLFVIRGEGFDGSQFQFSDLELVTDKTEYAPGDKVELLINTNRVGSNVLLFVRPSNGVYAGRPQQVRIDGKSATVSVEVQAGDMPNFFIEAVTIAGGRVHTVLREVIVPPEQRVLNVEVQPGQPRYLPGAQADVRVKVTDAAGQPYRGSLVLAVYDRAIEYISGGSNVPEIREFFWKWRRSHHPQTESSLERWFWNLVRSGETSMQDLGAFGDLVADQSDKRRGAEAQPRMLRKGAGAMNRFFDAAGAPAPAAAPMMEMAIGGAGGAGSGGAGPGGAALVQPTIRQNFADTAYWNAALITDADGFAAVTFPMPENLSDWKVRAWGMGHGTRVGEGTANVVTAKNLIVRLQAPRFFVEKDEVVLSAIVHNYLETEKQCQVELVLEGGTMELMESSVQSPVSRAGAPAGSSQITIPANGEVRVDWRCKVVREGQAVITMKALTDEESDAMRQTFPVYVHGFLKTESFAGVIRGQQTSGVVEFTVPADRRPDQTRFEVRYSPTLAGAMVDALPYLVDYPYGCTEQTLNRFLPTVITQDILKRLGVNLKEVQEKRTNLNAQEIGDDRERAADWRRLTQNAHDKDWNPVFDEAEVERMVKQGVEDLTAMQLSDGGWGWFSGWGEHSHPHTTAVVVHGLQLAQANGVALVPDVLENGVAWLKRYQEQQVEQLKLYQTTEGKKGKSKADNIDALVYMVLVDADVASEAMQGYLYRDRLDLSLYAQALLGLALHKQQDFEKRDMIIRNLDQFLKVDNENQTAYLDLPNNSGWWYWHGSTIEANAFYLKLLTAVNSAGPPQVADERTIAKAAGLVKYLLNNRRHATYWNSTRDTAYCIEALAEFLVASGEAEPNLLVEVWLDGKLQKAVEITPAVLFSFDNRFVIEGEALAAGKHTLELKTKRLESRVQGPESRAGSQGGNSQLSTLNSPLYYNAYLTNFSTEDHITAAGLEIKVGRKFYKLVRQADATDVVRGERGQALDQQAVKYDRIELVNLSEVQSGDLIEIELEIDSKNDYEYVIFEDLKAAGCEPVDLQSGYTRGGLGAYVEFRDERVAFFLRTLARGKHSVSYRVRAETPGRFSALPTRAYAMYAPELKGNSEEMKLGIME